MNLEVVSDLKLCVGRVVKLPVGQTLMLFLFSQQLLDLARVKNGADVANTR